MRLVKWAMPILALTLNACASVYDVRPQPVNTQVSVFNNGVESLRSKKVHEVEVGSSAPQMVQFDDLRFMVSFTNHGKNPVEFSPANVAVTLNGQVVPVLSYEAQLQDIENRLSYYGYRLSLFPGPGYIAPFYQSGVGYGGRFGFGFGNAGFDDGFNDRLDVQRAYNDLERLKRLGLKPKVVKPGETSAGEITLARRLPAGSVQYLSLDVTVDGEAHHFEFGYHSRR
ncbi:hypothetical protein NQT62_06795 [Limnobacter humi]|uniref:Lipoprotein n=1 Tax=Limnobacter humi TaxID=1778671 RepID=A0ABT1WFJ7_9BURK|nr:hypothetical protein [Limnobacter humi]MCQ8896144.1 hypothetical protein [Limnobacter humi]